MGAVGQILLKAGANKLGEYNLGLRNLLTNVWTLLKVPQILVGMIFFGLSFLLWIKILTQSELSHAYPMVSLSYVIVGIASAILFKEPVTANKVFGIGTIVLGVIILNR